MSNISIKRESTSYDNLTGLVDEKTLSCAKSGNRKELKQNLDEHIKSLNYDRKLQIH